MDIGARTLASALKLLLVARGVEPIKVDPDNRKGTEVSRQEGAARLVVLFVFILLRGFTPPSLSISSTSPT